MVGEEVTTLTDCQKFMQFGNESAEYYFAEVFTMSQILNVKRLKDVPELPMGFDYWLKICK